MKKKIFTAIFIAFTILCYSQKEKKGNPIIFAEISLTGVSIGSNAGGNLITAVNYQKKNNLFTYRYLSTTEIDSNYGYLLVPFVSFFGSFLNPVITKEHSLLFGKRYIKDDYSFSFSLGLSINRNYSIIYKNKGLEYESFTTKFNNNKIGLPFEFNIRWIKPKKEKPKLLGMFPFGKPTGFGVSMGFKIFGNVSKKSSIGIGLTYGFGFFKNYL